MSHDVGKTKHNLPPEKRFSACLSLNVFQPWISEPFPCPVMSPKHLLSSSHTSQPPKSVHNVLAYLSTSPGLRVRTQEEAFSEISFTGFSPGLKNKSGGLFFMKFWALFKASSTFAPRQRPPSTITKGVNWGFGPRGGGLKGNGVCTRKKRTPRFPVSYKGYQSPNQAQ